MTLPAWVPDVETKPAPMPLLLLQSFVNTWEGDSGVDLLADPEAGPPRWLEEGGVLRGSDIDLVRVRALREGIRALLVANSGEADLEPSDVDFLRGLAEDVRLQPVVLDGTVHLRPADAEGLS